MRKIFFFRGLREEIKCTWADEGRYLDSKGGEFSSGCKASLWGTKQLQAEQEGNDHAERAKPQSVSVGNGGGRTKQASMELHWDCYSPEARERLETLRMQGLTWRLSCARSWPHMPMSCRFHHGEHAELLSLEWIPRPVTWPKQVTLEAPAPPWPQRDERMKHPNRSLSQSNKRSRGKPHISRKPSCSSPAQRLRWIPTPGHVDPASILAVVTCRKHICKPQTSTAGLC